MPPTRSCEIYIDGASRGNPGPSGVGAAFFDGGSKPVKQLSRYLGETTNNVAEYLALIYALQDALRERYAVVMVKTDSELLARQLSGQYRVRDPQLRILHDLAAHLIEGFDRCAVTHVPRTQNRLADRLAGQAADHRVDQR
ncbi:MAG: ribonuclease HI family protein [Candidatus Omnitrophica bacterium]|nr:ribonuclease HI family protein [Candidatus Omnitrophota bacterium]